MPAKKATQKVKKAYKLARPRRVYGRGGYFSDKIWPKLRPVLKAGGRAALGTAASLVPYVGNELRNNVETLWDKIVGSGDYAPMTFSVGHNSFMDKITANGPPSMWTTNREQFVFRHREYIGDIITSSTPGAFNLQEFPIQPGEPSTFPWLAERATGFQQYRVNGMLFEFVSTSSDALNSTNTALGTVVMATNYNAGEAAFSNKQQMMATEFASVCKPSKSMLHPIECKPSLTSVTELYVRNGDLPTGQDPRLYDLGNFQIATVGMQGASVNIGELWVTYEIVFLKPIISPTTSVSADSNFYHATGSSIGPSNPFGTIVAADGNNLDISIPSGGRDIYFNDAVAGESYLVHCSWIGSSTASVQAPSLTTSNGMELKNLYQNYATPTAGNQSGLTTTTLNLLIVVECVTSATASIKPQINFAPSGTFPSSITSFDLLITKINPNIAQPSLDIFRNKNVKFIENHCSDDEEEAELVQIEKPMANLRVSDKKATEMLSSSVSAPTATKKGWIM